MNMNNLSVPEDMEIVDPNLPEPQLIFDDPHQTSEDEYDWQSEHDYYEENKYEPEVHTEDPEESEDPETPEKLGEIPEKLKIPQDILDQFEKLVKLNKEILETLSRFK